MALSFLVNFVNNSGIFTWWYVKTNVYVKFKMTLEKCCLL